MKNLIYFLIIILLSSCDPDVAGEGINLPTIDYNFKILTDTPYHKIGDTITISTKTSTTLSNGIKINNGKSAIDFSFAYTNQIPIVSELGTQSAKVGVDFDYYLVSGNIVISPINSFTRIYVNPIGDNFEFEIKLIPKKIGTYSMLLQPNFFEGTQGKTRTNPYFDIVKNNGEELWQVPGMPAITPDNPVYKTKYYFAVTE